MDKKQIEREYSVYLPHYRVLEDEVVSLLKKIKRDRLETVDIYKIESRIKEIDSISEKINRFKEEFKSILSIQDIVGVRLICHCRSDLDRLDTILREELNKRFVNVEHKDLLQESGYRGVHYIITKEIEVSGENKKLPCEIQLRTVLQDAWAVQSHLYGYKRKVEGDANILKKVVSGILDNCENLWELVRKSVKGKEVIGGEEAVTIYQETSRKVDHVRKIKGKKEIEKAIASNNIVALEDFIEKEFQKVKEKWEEIYSSHKSPTEAIDLLEKIEASMKGLILLGLTVIKYNKVSLFRKILDKFGAIASLSDKKGGCTVILSLPGAALHNAFYYFGVYGIKKLNSNCIRLLLDYKMEREHNGQFYYSRFWETGSIFAPEVIRGADKTFNRLKEDFEKNKDAKEFLSVDVEEFMNLACQFNFLFVLKATIDREKGLGKPWAYANFGRFYGFRISRLIQRIENREDHQKFIEGVFDEKKDIFLSKLDGRIKTIAHRGLGSGYFWSSLEEWTK